jgi:hypothetical protein
MTHPVRIVVAVWAAFLVLILPLIAAAQQQCAPRETAVKNLAEKYNEHPIGMGLDDRGIILEVFVSEGGETWTIVVTRPDGVSCAVASGQGWRRPLLKPKGTAL